MKTEYDEKMIESTIKNLNLLEYCGFEGIRHAVTEEYLDNASAEEIAGVLPIDDPREVIAGFLIYLSRQVLSDEIQMSEILDCFIKFSNQHK